MDVTDARLIGEIRGGSATAFERLMERYERLVYKIAYGYTGEREGALDVSQNVFLRVHSRLDLYRPDGRFKSWIARVAINESISWKRAQRRHRASALDETQPRDDSPGQDDRVWQREAWELVRRSLDDLAPSHRLAIVLRYFEGLPVREIAELLGRSEGVVKSILFRSVKKMRVDVRGSMEVAS